MTERELCVSPRPSVAVAARETDGACGAAQGGGRPACARPPPLLLPGLPPALLALRAAPGAEGGVGVGQQVPEVLSPVAGAICNLSMKCQVRVQPAPARSLSLSRHPEKVSVLSARLPARRTQNAV
eukprot:951894-Rhodomonas_salina.1